MKISEMESGVTYIICPDKKCKLFWDTTRPCPCDGKCPHGKKVKLVIICLNCHGMIVLPGNHCSWCRIDHACPNGMNAMNFRMSGKYQLLHKMPRKQQKTRKKGGEKCR
ncbi:MAG: hypothetical protein PHE59_01040 [Patescibacteria group bacterium]|nr:hypothetical protein [Patescibacteria group bacterium]MDD5164257.1 hypothetical protein [Patescibacteria group bacterium]MDD5535063.1 hypothetical protein [Patescibacteria group bacterium]